MRISPLKDPSMVRGGRGEQEDLEAVGRHLRIEQHGFDQRALTGLLGGSALALADPATAQHKRPPDYFMDLLQPRALIRAIFYL